MEFIKSEKGNNKLIYNGYMNTFEKFGTEEKSIWKCDQYKKMKCKGRIHPLNNEILKEIQHNHVKDCGNIEAAKAVNLIKNMATQNVDLITRAVICSASTSDGILAFDTDSDCDETNEPDFLLSEINVIDETSDDEHTPPSPKGKK
ncbi:hypothetical protein ACI65C_006564 [Semiaphis heraclei]